MPLQQFDCKSWAINERWRLVPAYKDPFTDQQYYFIRNEQSGKCVNIAYGSTDNGASVVQYTCRPWYSNEWFALTRTDDMQDDYFKLKNYNSRKCINVAGGSADNHARIIQYECSAYWPQNDWNMQVRFQKLT